MKLALRSITALALLSAFLLTQPLFAAKDSKPTKLFKDKSEWNVTLAGPWRTIQRNVEKDMRYPAQLTYPGGRWPTNHN